MKYISKIKNLINRSKLIRPTGILNEKDILLEAGQGKNINGNMFALLKEIEYGEKWKDYTPYFVVTEDTIDAAKTRFAFYNFKRVKLTLRGTREYYELLNSSKYIMTDNSFPTNYQKQKGQVYLNTWHGTPLKYLGRPDIKNATSLGNIQKNYFMCDYALFPNHHTKNVFMKDYMLERYFSGKNVLADYPRNAALLDQDNALVLRKKLNLDNKKVIAYMPTWRGSNRSADSEGQVKIIKEKLEKIDASLHENEILYVNLHFLVSSALDFSSFKHILPFPKEYETYDFLNVCDTLITDYSSVFFDFAVTNKQIILYAYDKEDYLRDKGMYMDIHTFPFPIVETEEELLEEIHNNDVEDRSEFNELYTCYADKDINDKILELVINGNNQGLLLEDAYDNGKKNIMCHVGNLRSYLSRDIINEIVNKLDYENNNITLCFEGGITPSKVDLLKGLPEDVYYYSLIKAETIYLLEYIYNFFFIRLGMFKNKISSYYKREKDRLFSHKEPDEVHVYMFQNKKYAYIYELFKSQKFFHRLPESVLGLKVYQSWYVRLLDYVNKHYDEVVLYHHNEIKDSLYKVESYDSSISFKIKGMHVKQKNDNLHVNLKLDVRSYRHIDFTKYKIKVGNRLYTPRISVKPVNQHGYNRWTMKVSFDISFEESKGQELQNKVCFIDETDLCYRITYTRLWRQLNSLKPLKIFIDKQRALTYFFRYPKDTLTLTLRDVNVTDHLVHRIKIVIAYCVSKLLFFFKPVLFFEKNAARYEESASVVYENLMDSGYRNGYFVLDKDYLFKDQIAEKYRSNIIDKYSFKHYVCFFAAKSFIGSESKVHAFELRPISKLVTGKLNRSQHNYVFLQHGVMYMVSLDAGRRTFFKKSQNKKVRQRTIVSSQLELNHFVELGGYNENDLYLCGLPKFDRNTINDNPEKIVVMITWRPWEFIQSLDDIEETTYYKMIKNIVDHIPEEYKKHLYVLPHPLVENQMRSSECSLKDYVPEVMKYDDILKDTKILITDYSSISYDAFYRGCNVIFCWQEKEDCLKEYGTNAKLMLTEELAFGDVNYDYDLLDETVRYNYTHSQKSSHLDNYKQIVEFHDGNNTKRLIEMLRKENMI